MRLTSLVTGLALLGLGGTAGADRIWCGTFALDRPGWEPPVMPFPPAFTTRLTHILVDGGHDPLATAKLKLADADCHAAGSGELVLRVAPSGVVTDVVSRAAPACLVDTLRHLTFPPAKAPRVVSAHFAIELTRAFDW